MDTRIRAGTAADMDAAADIWQAAHASRLGFVPEGARKERAMAVRARALYERNGFEFTGREKVDDYGERIAHYYRRLASAALGRPSTGSG